MSSDARQVRPTCVVIDTSVWRSELLLKTPLGLTLVYTVSRRGGFIGLPEVVELELKRQIVKAGLEAADEVRGPLHLLSTLIDDPVFWSEPTEDNLGKAVDERLEQLTPLLVREPFTIEHAKAALEMVNDKVPPNDKNQQFKDSAIWRAIMSLSLRYGIVLLTIDKAFYQEKNAANGLARNLMEECSQLGTSVSVYYGIGPYLESINRDAPSFDRERVLELISPTAIGRLETETRRLKSLPSELVHSTVFAFSTEDVDRLAIDYTLTFKVEPSTQGLFHEWREQRGFVHGSAYFIPSKCLLTDHYVQRVTIKSPGMMSSRDFKDYDGSYAFPRPLTWE